MKARSTYVALIALVAVIVVVSGMPKSPKTPTLLNRISDAQAEAEGKTLAADLVASQDQSLIDSQHQSLAGLGDTENQFRFPFVNEPYYFKDIPTTGNYPLSTSLGSSFDHRIVRLRPRTCPHQDKTDQPMFHCPTPDLSALTEWKCIRFADLCNGVPDCPQREDEHPTFCMFHELQNAEVNKLRQIIVNVLDSVNNHHEMGEAEDQRRRL